MQPEKYLIEQDIQVMTYTATSFPLGIEDAHRKIQQLFKDMPPRRCFGISRPEHGTITYMAAAEQLHPYELKETGLEGFVIEKGEYISILIKDFRKDIALIDKAFNLLISRSDIDPKGYCIEWYLDENDVQCLVRIISS